MNGKHWKAKAWFRMAVVFSLAIVLWLPTVAQAEPGYVLDGFGGVHAIGGAGVISPATPYFGFDIAKAVQVTSDGTGIYVLDGFGGVHAGGTASTVTGSPYFGWDIARDLELVRNVMTGSSSGHILDVQNNAALSYSAIRGYIGSATSNGYGVFGQTDSTNGGTGVYGWAAATSGTNYGVAGRSESPTGYGVFGYAIDNSGGANRGVYGRSNSPLGYGVYGDGGLWGVYGKSWAGIGVDGYATATSGTNWGVRGISDSVNGYGVEGVATATSGTTWGVHGQSLSPGGRGVQGTNSAGGYAGWFQGNVWVSGNLSAGGTKPFIQPHAKDPNKEIVYVAAEAPEALILVRGKARLKHGQAVIELPEHFQVVAAERGIDVSVTPYSSETRGLAVVERSRERIVVRELAQGKGSFEFGYFVTATRAGFEAHQPVMANTHFKPRADESAEEFEARYSGDDMTTQALRAMLISSGILSRDGKLNLAKVKARGWRVAEESKTLPPALKVDARAVSQD